MYTATAVSYLNTKPFLYGIFNEGLDKEIKIELDIPSACASKLKAGTVDFGLVPVAIIPELESAYLISDYCIGTVGAVKTVAIFSDVPLEEIKDVYLDFHSRTSVQLAQILLKHHWKHQPNLMPATEGFIDTIEGTTAAVVIGDRCVGLDQKHRYVYDLGEAWMDFTGLPFVFAAWVSRKPLPAAFIERFNQALKNGLDHIPQLVKLIPAQNPDFDLARYFNEYISYPFDANKKQALAKFLDFLNSDMPMIQNGNQVERLVNV